MIKFTIQQLKELERIDILREKVMIMREEMR